MLPVVEGSETHLVVGDGSLTVGIKAGIRQIEIPNDAPGMIIVGPGPRFTGQLCVHELIAYQD